MMLESGSYSSSQSKSCLLCVSAVGHQQKAVPHTFKRVAHVRQYRAQSGPPEIQLFALLLLVPIVQLLLDCANGE